MSQRRTTAPSGSLSSRAITRVPRGGPPVNAAGRALLDAYRAEHTVPTEVQERVWSRLRRDFLAPATPRSALPWFFAGAVAAAAAALLWIASGPSSTAERQTANEGAAAYDRASDPAQGRASAGAAPAGSTAQRRPVPAPSPTPAPPGPAAAEGPAPDEADDPTESATGGEAIRERSKRRRPSASPPAATADTLAEESRLLHAARRALLANDPATALDTLATHRRLFPRGLLRQERQGLQAIALCERESDSHGSEGQATARRFLDQFPKAALATRVRGACFP